MTIWQARIIEVREKAQEMKREAERLKDRPFTKFTSEDLCHILWAWADDIEAIVSPRRAHGR